MTNRAASLKKLPHGEPTQRYHRMEMTTKHIGTPRRNVELSLLNKFCKREAFALKIPFHLAHQIPGRT